jgi:DNA-binding response OmpR family regulator
VRKVLLIDDEAGITRLVALCLEPLGVEVVHAVDLDGALAVLARGVDVGLVLLDLALDSEDGLDILPRLRAAPQLKDVPVVAFTAHDSRRREALARGIDSFIVRPFAFGDLQSAVEVHLLRAGAQQPTVHRDGTSD